MRRLCSVASTCARLCTSAVQPFISSRTMSSRSAAALHSCCIATARAAPVARRRSPQWKIGTDTCKNTEPSSVVVPSVLGV